MFSTLKGAKNLFWGCPKEFAGSTQNYIKIIDPPNQLIRTTNFQKKSMLGTLKKKRS
jgi:hypothetical protein